MRTSLRWTLVALVAWTLFVWPTRIKNALGDSATGTGGKVQAVLLSLSLIAFAVAGIVILVRRWRSGLTSADVTVLRLYAAWSTVVWLVFGTIILVHDHPVPFKAVHVTLGLISIGLAVATWRQAKVGPAPDGGRPTPVSAGHGSGTR